jgi:predicted MFS family arabinose efflux permease
MTDHASRPHAIASAANAPPRCPTLLLASACGLIVANIYYPQSIVGPISAALGLPPGAAGLIVTMTQLGYGAGLLLIVPMGDLLENRRLIVTIVAAAALALAGAAISPQAAPFLACAALIGLCSVAAQILVPFAAHLSPEATRGRVVGEVMSGLMLGIMLARPAASLITALASWRAVFAMGAVAMVAAAIGLRVALPRRQPAPGLSYPILLASLGRLVRDTPVLRRRAAYHAGLFGAFSLFWTTAPLLLTSTFHLTQIGVALFALAGVAGAIAAPIAGRVADRGWTRPATGLAMLAAAASFGLDRLGLSASPLRLGALVAAAILLDFGVTANLVLGQRALFTLAADIRSRLNGLYMAIFFMGGAVGSALGGWAYAVGGWSLCAWIGLGLPALTLVYWLTEVGARPRSQAPR